MKVREITTKTLGLLGFLLLVAGCVASTSASASARWDLRTLSRSSAESGSTYNLLIWARDLGDPVGGETKLKTTLPQGLTIASVVAIFSDEAYIENCTAENGESAIGQRTLVCPYLGTFPGNGFFHIQVRVAVDPSVPPGEVITEFKLEGGDGSVAETVDPIRIGPPPPFGVDGFDAEINDNEAGTPSTRAGSHPYVINTFIDFNRGDATDPRPDVDMSDPWPIEPIKDALVDQTPGFVGNPTSMAQCTLAQLGNSNGFTPLPLCPSASQVGTFTIHSNFARSPGVGPLPLYNLKPPPGVPARFGFNVIGVIVILDAEVRSSDYGITVASRNISEGLPIEGSTVSFWGVPADKSHDSERACPGKSPPVEGGPSCAIEDEVELAPFLRQPTSCTATAETGFPTTLRIDSWFRPGDFKESTFLAHEAPGYPYPRDQWGKELGLTNCEEVPFNPQISVQPTTKSADSPSGLEVDLEVPQDCWEDVNSICQSDLEGTEVTLPAGMKVNPSAASGLGACSLTQIGLHSNSPATCPSDSKIGDVSIDTPLLGENETPGEEDLKGGVYLARQGENPFGSLLGIYLVAEGSGVVIKQAGKIETGPDGRLVTRFDGVPQAPFSSLHLSLKGGTRAPLRTPSSCGAHSTDISLAPWSGNHPVDLISSFTLTSGPHGSACPNNSFDPKLSIGTVNPLAGAHSPFVFKLSREDGTQELGALSIDLPPGLLASLGGIPYCPDSALNGAPSAEGTAQATLSNPICPPGSQLGTVTVGAGAGPNPFNSETGKAYWAGPYKGAPVSLAVVVPALAGPFDLGNVVVRTRFEVNPETAKITAVSDPFPSQLHGITLDIRSAYLALDRPNYTLNPTNCDPMSFEADVTSTQAAVAHRSERFQVGGCERLSFKPKLKLQLKGATKRAGHPALKAVLTMPPGGANIAKAQVALPQSAFIDQSHFKTICTRVQYAAGAGGGAECPKGSVYGKARVYSPILGYYLSGPVYLRSSSHELPDLVVSLNGQIHIDVVGHIDSYRKGIRATFESVPDAPVSRFVLEMQGAKKGLIQNSTDICKGVHLATANFDAQNGKVNDSSPKLEGECSKKAKKRAHKKGY